MATKTVTLSDSIYTKLDTTADSAKSVQVKGGHVVRVVFAASLPAVTADNYFIIPDIKGISRDSMTGDMYGLSEKGAAKVVVGE